MRAWGVIVWQVAVLTAASSMVVACGRSTKRVPAPHLSLVQRDARMSTKTLRNQYMDMSFELVSRDTTTSCDAFRANNGCSQTSSRQCEIHHAGSEFVQSATLNMSQHYRCCCEKQLAREISTQRCIGYMKHGPGCDWTLKYSCPGQYRGPDHIHDAERDGSLGYACCCEQALWRKSMKKRIDRVQRLSRVANKCDDYLVEKGCSWTSNFPCPGQRQTVNTTHVATDDGSLGYQCCCEMNLWKQEATIKDDAMCNKHIQDVGCAWTTMYSCNTTQSKDIVGAQAFKCCCPDEYGPNGLMFIHIPKNAGTAIEEASARQKVWWPRKWLSFWRGVHMPDGSSCEKYHVPPQYLRVLGEPEGDISVFKKHGSFCVTRHPYDRAVSEYLYMLQRNWGAAMSTQYFTDLLEKPRCTPEGLNYFLQSALSKVLEGRKFLHDCHFLPQVEYIWGSDGYQWCNHVLRQEDLPYAFNELMASHGYLPRLQIAKINNSTEACGNITVSSLSGRTKRLIDTIYRDDFAKLNYTKAKWQFE
eukprot:TRINITY_DN68482_c0_g1_i1.p1 TRINITY_DN68482_c0_g1~~TRINITY_DN68482_c0_g1_i1.p1  ORF type:complete len:555 (+),score=38.07 TRINITY_DN68482_c0_g1_i1:81-1667(+)